MELSNIRDSSSLNCSISKRVENNVGIVIPFVASIVEAISSVSSFCAELVKVICDVEILKRPLVVAGKHIVSHSLLCVRC